MINNAFTDIVHIVDQKNVLPANLNQKNIKSR